MTVRRPSRLGADARGVSTVEFALVAPVLLMTLFGIFDIGYTTYIGAQLQGAIQKAARDSTLEGAGSKEATLDGKVSDAVHIIVPSATLDFTRKAYSTFSAVGQPEDFTDANSNGVCDDGEPFEDANANGTWDDDRGTVGFGGARDATLYTVEVTYKRPFPVTSFLGQDGNFTLTANTVLRNQPYGAQNVSSAVENCT